ncbi:MAG: hypothetical protein ACFE9R_07325, partial [Candidatus Hermodarchaeota archaeon]
MILFNRHKIKRRRILVLFTILISFILSVSLKNLDINANLGLAGKYYTDYDFQMNNLKSQDLTSDNSFTGIGAPWNVTHYANYTKPNLEISFNNNSYDANQQIKLDSGWTGYQLNSTIKNLYITNNLVNGTFHCGTYTGGSPPPLYDDSAYVANWTFGNYDVPAHTNIMMGNYFDETHSDSDGADCLQLRINRASVGNFFDKGDKCWWTSTFSIPQGEIEEGWISFAINPKYYDDYANHFEIHFIINDTLVWNAALLSLKNEINSALGYVGWYNIEKNINNINQIIPDGTTETNVTIELERIGTTQGTYTSDYGVVFDNVSLVVKEKAKPSEIGLKLNNDQVNDDPINDGEGFLVIAGNWNGDEQSSVTANFSSNYNWPLVFNDKGILRSYKVELKTNLTLYINKTTPESYYLADPELSFQGSSFTVSNNSIVNWTTYAHMEIPAGYEETNMTIEYPSDYNVTGVLFSLNPISLSLISVKEYGDKKIMNIPVSSITSNTNGFWRLKAVAPNYCTEMDIYNNATGGWELNNEFLSGEYINITAKINNSDLISSYITTTKARLRIRFPSGILWDVETQLKSPDSNGLIQFDAFQIPDSSPYYEAGQYQAIVTWNNSYSNFGLNETGIIYKNFMVIHDSYLVADTNYFEDIAQGNTINLKVSFYDSKDLKAITNANVSTTDFKGVIQQFSEINPGYYFLEFNTTGGLPGNNYINVTAKHPNYEDNEIQITIELIVQTILNAEEYPTLKVAWNNNFTIHLNYTYASNGTGIENADYTNDWNGETSTISSNGLYNVTLNNSHCEVNKVYYLTFTFDKNGCEGQAIIISIEIVSRETYIGSILINDIECIANKTYNIKSGELLNFKVTYNDLESSGIFVKNAIVTLNKSTEIGEVFEENPTYYNLTLSSTDLGLGTSFINIIAKKDNYTSTTVILTIIVFERNTDYKIYLDGIDFTTNPVITTYTNRLINLTVSYIDLETMLFISGATVDVNGSAVSEVLIESYGNYTVMLNTTELNFGANFLTIYARKGIYEPQSILLAIQIVQIESELKLYLNDQDKTLNPAITTYTNQFINLTVSYKEQVSTSFIAGAIVDINGSGVSEVLIESYENYTIMIDTSELNFGANFLTIYARKQGFEPQSITLTVQILQIETTLNLYLDGEDETSNPAITTYTDKLINLTISYKEFISTLFISGATVDVNGSGLSEVLIESYNNYTVMLDTSELNFGANFLSIYARKEGYEPQSITLTVQILQIETTLNLYLDGQDETSNPELTTYTDQLINFTVSYKEQISMLFISGATVDVNSTGVSEVLTESYNNYTVMIDTSKLRLGANFLTIYARKEGFEPQSIIVTVQIIEIETGVNVSLNGQDKTFLTITIRKSLTIAVNYFDILSSTAIIGSNVQAFVGENVFNLTEDSFDHQYYTTINTSLLDLGFKFLTVSCSRQNYQSASAGLTIQVIQIRTNVTTSTGATVFTIQPGQNFRLKINLTDLDFNAKVLHALVGYSFPFAQGNLTDDDNDGVYEATINANYLPVGTHEIRIYPIDAGIEYNFPQTYKIYVNVVSPPEDVLLFQVLTILGIGAAVGIGGYLFAYQKVLKYPKKVRKIHKFKSKLKKSKPLGIEIQSRDQILRERYSEHITALEKQI